MTKQITKVPSIAPRWILGRLLACLVFLVDWGCSVHAFSRFHTLSASRSEVQSVDPFKRRPWSTSKNGQQDHISSFSLRSLGMDPSTSASFSSPEPSETAVTADVAKVEQFARLPVWPVWMGVVIFVVSRTLGKEWAAKLEDAVGGRVCPNFFETQPLATTSPFIMLVHHRHSFASWDPIRWFQNQFILPEGFPSHPHRGFITLTYFLKGGFRHRDSLGVSQSYGADQSHHSQWLFTGAGLLHEEMFDDTPQQELYQLWINVPSFNKMLPPDVRLLGKADCPRCTNSTTGAETVVLAGNFGSESSAAPLQSPMTILHVSIPPGQTWTYPHLPPEYESMVLYVRQGSCHIAGTEVPVHHTAYLTTGTTTANTSSSLLVTTGKEGVDFLFLAGQPLNEPVAAQGSMVMNYAEEINRAYLDYQHGSMGRPWDHKLSDDEWLKHLREYPCQYQYQESASPIQEKA